MVEVLAVLRTIEKKYGRIIEFHVTKDFEMPDRPFAMIFAAFADPASLKLVPSRGIELAIPAPEYEHQPGGPGWKDIEEYLDEADRDPQFDRDNDLNLFGPQGHVRNHIYVRVSPSKLSTFPTHIAEHEHPSPEKQRRIAEQFLRWGGTKPLEPISSERPIQDQELFGESSLDNVRMRAALRWAAKALNKRSPYEIYPDEAVDATSLTEGDSPLVGQDVAESESRREDDAAARTAAFGETAIEEPLPTSKH
ncbi:hypothetical protein H1R20_g12825, partial [Candolleomyces eurysporus]